MANFDEESLMFTTEKEALKKHCCGPVGCGKIEVNDHTRYCIGSACMGWRTEARTLRTMVGNDLGEDDIARGWYRDGKPNRYRLNSDDDTQPWKIQGGHCGLAGETS